MSEHLVLSRWRECAPEIKRLAREYGLDIREIALSVREVISECRREARSELRPTTRPNSKSGFERRARR